MAKGRTEGRAEGLTQGRVEGRVEGLTQGRAEGLIKGRSEGLTKGLISGFQEMILETLTERFGRVSKPLSNQIQQIQQQDRLKQLQRQALRCQNLSQFRQLLMAQAK